MKSIISTVYGVDGAHDSPYRTKIQLPFGWRLHKFHRADLDRAWHDHPNHFWTFPFSSYVEEVFTSPSPLGVVRPRGVITRNVVKAWRWHYREAYYTHRLVGRADGRDEPYWTLVREILPEFRQWGFYVEQPDGSYRHIPWRAYVFEGVRS